ncbi:MAG TPA: SUMF1/EgtB/PvdO family nonheme iron enzyme [Planctomycetota bacterium]|nr:SUMF1/EgtB/PvdO family nonheme iron enzyme [Planctomycetota bacterium]
MSRTRTAAALLASVVATSACSDEGGFGAGAGADTLDLLADVVLVPPRGSDAPEAFFIQRTEVTNAEFARFLVETGYRRDDEAFLHHWRDAAGRLPEPPQPPRAIVDHPVVFVSLVDAQAYARHRRMRLPTPREFEAAAGTGEEYPFGSFWRPLHANTLELGLDHTTPVGTFESGRSVLGVYDLCGNVAEWTVDENGFSLKGGSFKDDRERARMSESEPVGAPWYLSSVCGFRCAQEAVGYLSARVLDEEKRTDARSAALAGMLSRGGAPARQVLDALVESRPDAESLVRPLLRP